MSLLYIFNVLLGLAISLSRVPYVGRMLLGAFFIALDVIVAFGDFSFLVGLPGWIPVVLGVGLILYVLRAIKMARGKLKNQENYEHTQS